MAEVAPQPQNPNQLKNHNINRGVITSLIVGGLAVAAAGGIWLSSKSMGPSRVAENLRPNPAQAPAHPGAITEKPAPIKAEVNYDSAMEKYKDMDVDTFEKLPLDERLVYSQYSIEKTAKEGNYDVVYGVGTDGEKFAVYPKTASLDNTGQEIADNFMYAQQIAFLNFIPGEEVNKPLDTVEAQKALSSAFYSVGKDKIVTNDYLFKTDPNGLMKPGSKPHRLGNKMDVTNTSELMTGEKFGEKVQYKIVTDTDSNDSKTYYSRYIYHEFTNVKGEKQGIWLLDGREFSLKTLTQTNPTK